jgi:hypothetical protein
MPRKGSRTRQAGGQVGLAHSRSFDAQRCALASHGEIVLRALCRNGGSDSSVASIGVNRRRPVQMQPDESIAAQRFRGSRQRSAGPAQQSGQRRQRQRQRQRQQQTSEVHAWRRCVQVQVAVVGSGAWPRSDRRSAGAVVARPPSDRANGNVSLDLHTREALAVRKEKKKKELARWE